MAETDYSTINEKLQFLRCCEVRLYGALSSWLSERDREIMKSPFASRCQLRDISGCIDLDDADIAVLLRCYQLNDAEKFKEHMREKHGLADSFDWQSYERLKTAKERGWRRDSIPASLVLKVFRRDKFRCVVCGSNENLQIDHIRPVIAGGTHDKRNLQTLCKKCNLKKGAKIPESFEREGTVDG